MDLITSYNDESDDEISRNTEDEETSCKQTERDMLCTVKTESENKSTECDYFGLVDPDTDDSDDNDDKLLVTRNTTENRKSCEKHKLSVDDNSAEAKFWRGVDEQVNWDDPLSLWKNNDASETNPCPVITSKPEACTTNNNQLTGNILKQSINNPLRKSCYFVHHKVAPYVHSNVITNKPPRRELCQLQGHLGAINRVRWCVPNYSHLLLTACMDKTVKIWNAFSTVKSCVQTLCHHDKAVKDAKWSPCGLHVLSCSYDKSSCLMDVEKGSCITRFPDDSFVTCVTYHPVNHHIFISGSCNSMKAWDCRTAPKPIKQFSYKDNFGQVQDIVFMANGNQFFSCNDLVTRDSSDRNIMAWDFSNAVVLSNQIYQERFTCCNMTVHPDQSCFLAQSQANYIALFSTVRPYKLNKCKRYDGHKVLSYSIGLDISHDGQFVASGSSDGSVPVYDYHTTRILKRINISQHQVALDVAWHPVLFSTLAIVTWDGNIHLWQ